MADTKISGLAAVTSLLGTDEFVLARSGATKKVTAADLSTAIGASVGSAHFIAGIGFENVTGTFTHVFNSSFAGSHSCQSDGNNGSEVKWPVFLAGGTYSFQIIAQTATNRAIHSFRLNGSEFDSWDAYSGGGDNNAVHTVTGIDVSFAAVYDFSILANGKNASSSGYYIVAHQFGFWKTA